MSLWQSPASHSAKVDHEGRSSRSTRRRRRPRRRAALPLVTLLEQRTLLSIATVTTLALSSSRLTYGQQETLTATVTDPPSSTPPTGGVVSFVQGSMTLGSKALTNGTATIKTTALAAGNDVVTAVYSGTGGGAGDFAGSRGATPNALIISTVAGGGLPANRQALYTTLSDPEAVAVDSSGNLFIADSNDNVVKEVNAATGTVTVVAGAGSPKSGIGDGGQATDAKLNFPEGVAVEGSGDDEELFIADTFDNVVREVNLESGIIKTFAGNYDGSQAGLSANPRRTYSGDNGPATAALLYAPIGIALDNGGNLFIADSYNNRIREVDVHEVFGGQTDIIRTVAGKYDNGNGGYSKATGPATATFLNGPSGVAVDSAGDIFIADSLNNLIRKVDGKTNDISTFAGDISASGPGGGSDDGNPATDATLNEPQGIWVTHSGVVYFADKHDNSIRDVALSSGLIGTVAGDHNFGYSGDGQAATSAELGQPTALALDDAGDIFIADTDNDAIREVAESGAAAKQLGVAVGDISTVAGGDALGFSGDTVPANASALAGPQSVALDGSNNIYIADAGNYAAREVTPGQDGLLSDGTITTVAGGTPPVYNSPLSGPAGGRCDGRRGRLVHRRHIQQ